MSLPRISPSDAKLLIEQGAILVDIRNLDEHARERIPQARNVPLPNLAVGGIGEGHAAIIFHCASGNRTALNVQQLAGAAGRADAFLLDGGIDAWKKAGLPVVVDRRQPIPIMRQVQIVAGGLVVSGAALGFAVHPGFYLLCAAVGVGLMFAGISGFCTMARLLALMPWNRRAQA